MELEKRNNHEEPNDLVATWLAYYQELEECGDFSQQAKPNSPYYWAIDALDDIGRNQPELCWTLILQLADKATLDLQFSSIAAGPLEDLLCHNGPDFIERIEAEAKKNSHFRNLLSGVWRNTIDSEVWERIHKFC